MTTSDIEIKGLKHLPTHVPLGLFEMFGEIHGV